MLTVYHRVLRERFELLHPVLRGFLGEARGGRAVGRVRVTRARGRLRNLVAAALGIPPAGEYELVLEVLSRGETQRWVRRFGRFVLETAQREHRGLLVESSGPGSIGFELSIRDGALLFRPCRAWVFGIPLPLWLAPRIEVENRPNRSGGWQVWVHFGVPFLGQVAAYEGEVQADAPPRT